MEFPETRKVIKKWGEEIWMVNTDLYCGKKLILRKGKRCSLHYHKNKDETFYIDSGKVLMEVEGEKNVLIPREAILIRPGIKHRFSGLEDSVIIEISTHHEDSDSYRVKGELSGDMSPEDLEKYKVEMGKY